MKRWALGASIIVFGLAFVAALDVGYSRWSELSRWSEPEDERVGVGYLVWYLVIASPLLALALLAWREWISSVALAAGVLISTAIIWAAFHTAWTDESSTAALALLAAPLYGLTAVSIVFALDRIVDALRRRRAAEP